MRPSFGLQAVISILCDYISDNAERLFAVAQDRYCWVPPSHADVVDGRTLALLYSKKAPVWCGASTARNSDAIVVLIAIEPPTPFSVLGIYLITYVEASSSLLPDTREIAFRWNFVYPPLCGIKTTEHQPLTDVQHLRNALLEYINRLLRNWC